MNKRIFLGLCFLFCAFIVCAEEVNPLKDKKLLFCGDSITAAIIMNNGYRRPVSERGWAAFVGKTNEMSRWVNMGKNGASISDYMSANTIFNQLDYVGSTGEDFDYVILTGGTNDAWYNVEIGEMAEGFDAKNFNLHTYAGGLEYSIYLAKKYFPSSAIGFIINFKHCYPKSPKVKCRLADQDDMRQQYAMAAKICKKWKIPCLDLYNNDEITKKLGTDILPDKSAVPGMRPRDYHKAVPDVIHPSDIGYAIMEPVISAWMKKELAPIVANYKGTRSSAKPIAEITSKKLCPIKITDKKFSDCEIGFMGDVMMQKIANIIEKKYAPKRIKNYAGINVMTANYSNYPVVPENNQWQQSNWLRQQAVGRGRRHLPVDKELDYIFVMTPMRDAEDNVPAGIVGESRDKKDFDVRTFAGGLEHFFADLREQIPDKPIIYSSFVRHEAWVPGRISDMAAYWDNVKKACKKWNVIYLDLFESDCCDELRKKALAQGPGWWWWEEPETMETIADYLYQILR